MTHQDTTERFTTKCTEATLGYANAGFFAGLHAASAMMENWCSALETISNPAKKTPKSWFRHPDQFGPWDLFNAPTSVWADLWSPQVNLAQTPLSPWPFTTPDFFSPWGPYWPNTATTTPTFNMPGFPLPAALSVWPMTWSMMAMGIPHDVAKPTAEANAAAYDALESATQIANESVAELTKALEPTDHKPVAAKSSADPEDPFALFRPWYLEPQNA